MRGRSLSVGSHISHRMLLYLNQLSTNGVSSLAPDTSCQIIQLFIFIKINRRVENNMSFGFYWLFYKLVWKVVIKDNFFHPTHVLTFLNLQDLWDYNCHWMYITLYMLMFFCVCVCVISLYRIKESSGWQQVFSSPYLDRTLERIALNAKVVGGPHGDKDKMVAASSESSIILWSIHDGGSGNEIGKHTDTRTDVQFTVVKRVFPKILYVKCSIKCIRSVGQHAFLAFQTHNPLCSRYMSKRVKVQAAMLWGSSLSQLNTHFMQQYVLFKGSCRTY